MLAASLCLVAASALPGLAATYHVAAAGANASAADGSASRPWPSVEAALRSGKIKGGDVVLLADGDHGPLHIQDANFPTPVTIRSQNEKKAHVEYVYVHGNTRNVTVANLSVWSSNANKPVGPLVSTAQTASDLKFVGLDIRGGKDAGNYLNWSKSEWLSRAVDGIMIYSPRTVVRRNQLTGVRFGIAISADDGWVGANRISGFSADGLRGNGANNQFRANYVENCVSVDENHPDGFQAFTQTRIVGLLIERNTIMEWTADPKHPLRCGLQGIGLFDGFYDNLLIRNNVVSTRMGHGITVMGARNARITHNTVVQAEGLPGNYPWIAVYGHKNGSPSTDVVVANNLAMAFGGGSNGQQRIVYSGNVVISYPAKVFANVAKFDYRPKADSGFIDKANQTYSPVLDIERKVRPIQKGSDLGAYEMGAPPAGPGVTEASFAATLQMEAGGPRPAVAAPKKQSLVSASQAAADTTDTGAVAATGGTTDGGGAKFVTAP
jgi:hypothetical protein